MIYEMAHTSFGPHFIVQVVIVASDIHPIGPHEWQNREGPGAIRIREDPGSPPVRSGMKRSSRLH